MKSPEPIIFSHLWLNWNSSHNFAFFYAKMLAIFLVQRIAIHTAVFHRHPLDLTCCLTGYYPIHRTIRLVRLPWVPILLVNLSFAKDACQKLAVERRHDIYSLVAGQSFRNELLVGPSEQLFEDQKVW